MSEARFRTPYPHYDVLDKWDSPSWDATTREVVRARLRSVPVRRFLSEHEYRTLEALCRRILPQPERGEDAVPIAPWIDSKLHENAGDGYRHADLPPLREAWRKGLAGFDEESRQRHGRQFVELAGFEQDEVLRAVQRGGVSGGTFREEVAPTRFFEHFLVGEIVSVYYAHPSAWSEIGFGGPASPRGYVRLQADRADPWEAQEADLRGDAQ